MFLNFRGEVCLRPALSKPRAGLPIPLRRARIARLLGVILLMAATSDLAISCYETSSEQHALSASRLNLTKEKHKGKMNKHSQKI